ncbi:MAG: pilus assembly protein TadG-related protein [Hyphomonadaceae bacterium]
MRLKPFLRAEAGAISMLTALSGVAVIGFAGLATDVGAVYFETRRLQGAADLAALAAAQHLGRAQRLATETARANNWPDASLRVETGAYTPDPAVRPAARFTPAAGSANAVRVEVSAHTPLYFARLFVPEGRMRITRRATAAQTRFASFQIGSRLLSLNGGVANQVLSELTGSNVSLSVMDYSALLQADVDLLTYVDSLSTHLDLEAASFDQTLAHEIDAPDAIELLAQQVRDQRASQAMRALASASHGAPSIQGLNRLIDLGPYGEQSEATLTRSTEIRVNALDLATAMLQLAGGDRQVRLDLGASVPGLADTDVWLAIGERPNNSPWLSVTDDSDVVVRTAQMRLFIDARVRPLGALASVAQVRVPVLVEAASAQARLTDVACGFDPRDRTATLSVAPSVGALMLGDIDIDRLDNFRRPLAPARADLVRTPLIRVQGSSRVDLGGEQWQSVRFSRQDIETGAVKNVRTRDIARASVSTLFQNADLNVQVGGLGLGAQPVTAALSQTLGAAAAPLDALINGLSDLLGLGLGEADVRVNGVRCGGAALVG